MSTLGILNLLLLLLREGMMYWRLWWDPCHLLINYLLMSTWESRWWWVDCLRGRLTYVISERPFLIVNTLYIGIVGVTSWNIKTASNKFFREGLRLKLFLKLFNLFDFCFCQQSFLYSKKYIKLIDDIHIPAAAIMCKSIPKSMTRRIYPIS
jgi:hypothetical protein